MVKLYKCLKCKRLVTLEYQQTHIKHYHPELDIFKTVDLFKDIDEFSVQETLKI